jgi:hypothetical protein
MARKQTEEQIAAKIAREAAAQAKMKAKERNWTDTYDLETSDDSTDSNLETYDDSTLQTNSNIERNPPKSRNNSDSTEGSNNSKSKKGKKNTANERSGQLTIYSPETPILQRINEITGESRGTGRNRTDIFTTAIADSNANSSRRNTALASSGNKELATEIQKQSSEMQSIAEKYKSDVETYKNDPQKIKQLTEKYNRDIQSLSEKIYDSGTIQNIGDMQDFLSGLNPIKNSAKQISLTKPESPSSSPINMDSLISKCTTFGSLYATHLLGISLLTLISAPAYLTQVVLTPPFLGTLFICELIFTQITTKDE